MNRKSIVLVALALALPGAAAADSTANGYLDRFTIAMTGGNTSISGDAGEFLRPGPAFGLALSYNKKSLLLGNTSYSLHYILSRHEGKGDEEGTDYRLHRALFMYGSHYLVSRFDLDYALGAGLVITEWRTEEETGGGCTFLFGGGLGAEYRLAGWVGIAARGAFCHGTYLKSTYYYTGYYVAPGVSKSQAVNFLDVFAGLKFHFGDRGSTSPRVQKKLKLAGKMPDHPRKRPSAERDDTVGMAVWSFPGKWRLGFGIGGFAALITPSPFSAKEEYGARNVFVVPFAGKALIQYCKTASLTRQRSTARRMPPFLPRHPFFYGVRVELRHFSSSETNTSNTWRGGSHQDSRSIVSGNSLSLLGVLGGGEKHVWSMKGGLVIANLQSEVTRTDVEPDETSNASGVSAGLTYGFGYGRRLGKHVMWRLLDYELTLFVNHHLNLYNFHSPFTMVQLGSEVVLEL